MKAISIHQPYAWLIVRGYKTVENRSWSTKYRGPLAIHAGKTIDREGLAWAIEEAQADGEPFTESELAEIQTTGAIIGVVEVVDCTQHPRAKADRDWHNPGSWAWVLRNPRVLDDPQPAIGKLGLFDIDIAL